MRTPDGFRPAWLRRLDTKPLVAAHRKSRAAIQQIFEDMRDGVVTTGAPAHADDAAVKLNGRVLN